MKIRNNNGRQHHLLSQQLHAYLYGSIALGTPGGLSTLECPVQSELSAHRNINKGGRMVASDSLIRVGYTRERSSSIQEYPSWTEGAEEYHGGSQWKQEGQQTDEKTKRPRSTSVLMLSSASDNHCQLVEVPRLLWDNSEDAKLHQQETRRNTTAQVPRILTS